MYLDVYQTRSAFLKEAYRHLHADGNVIRGSAPLPEFGECWYVIGYEEALSALRNNKLIHDRSKASGHASLSNFSGSALEFWQLLTAWPLFLDPPEHSSKRLLLTNFFKEQSIQALEKFIEQTCNELLNHALAKHRFDLMSEFAYPLTTRVICKLMGIKPPDIDWFKQRSTILANALDFHATQHDYRPAIQAIAELKGYLAEELRQVRKDAGMLSSLARHEVPESELISLLLQTLFAGQETSADAIGNLMLSMDQQREVWQMMMDNNGLASRITRESLRYASSLQFSGIRTASEDIWLGRTLVKQGQSIVIANSACNHDPVYFQNPEVFDCMRDITGPELSFGHGIHYCLGVHLARLEMEIALKCLANRLPPDWQIQEHKMRENIVFHGPIKVSIGTS